MDASEALDLGRTVGGLHGLGAAETSAPGFPWSSIHTSPLRAGSHAMTGHASFPSHASYTNDRDVPAGLGASPGSAEKVAAPPASSGEPSLVGSPLRSTRGAGMLSTGLGSSSLLASHSHAHASPSPPTSMGRVSKGVQVVRRGNALAALTRYPPGNASPPSSPTPRHHQHHMETGSETGAPPSPSGVLQTLDAGRGQATGAQAMQTGPLSTGASSAHMMHTLLSEVVDPAVSAALTGYAVHSDALEGISAVCEAMFTRAASLRDAARGGATVPALLLGPVLMLHSRLSELLGKQPAVASSSGGSSEALQVGSTGHGFGQRESSSALPDSAPASFHPSTTVVGLTEGLDLGLHLSLTGLPLQTLHASHSASWTDFGLKPQAPSTDKGTEAGAVGVSRRMKAGKGKAQTALPTESRGLVSLTDGYDLGHDASDAAAAGNAAANPSKSTLSMLHMIALGLVQPGTAAVHMVYKGVRFHADLLPDGTLRDADTGKLHAAPSTWTLACKRSLDPSVTASNGWLHARVGDSHSDNAPSLRAVWDKYLAAQLAASAAVVPPPSSSAQTGVLATSQHGTAGGGASALLHHEPVTVTGGLQGMVDVTGGELSSSSLALSPVGALKASIPETLSLLSSSSSSSAGAGDDGRTNGLHTGKREALGQAQEHAQHTAGKETGQGKVASMQAMRLVDEEGDEEAEEEGVGHLVQGPHAALVEMTGVALPDRHRRCKHAGCPQILSLTNYTHEFKDELPEHVACMEQHGPVACEACAGMAKRMAKRSLKRGAAASSSDSAETGRDLSGVITSSGPGSGLVLSVGPAGMSAGVLGEPVSQDSDRDRDSKRARLTDASALSLSTADDTPGTAEAGPSPGSGAVVGGGQGKGDGSMRKCRHLLCPVLVSAGNRSHDYLSKHKRHVECFAVHGRAGACVACGSMAERKDHPHPPAVGETQSCMEHKSAAFATSDASVHTAQATSGSKRGRPRSVSGRSSFGGVGTTVSAHSGAGGAGGSKVAGLPYSATPSLLALLQGTPLSLAMLPVPDPQQLLAALPLQYGPPSVPVPVSASADAGAGKQIGMATTTASGAQPA